MSPNDQKVLSAKTTQKKTTKLLLAYQEKVSHFIETAEKVKSHVKSSRPAPKVKRPEFDDLDDSMRSDDCLLTVSDKVSKFTASAKPHIPEHKKPVSLAKMDEPLSQPNECVQIDSEEDTYTRTPTSRGSSPTKPSPDHDSTPKTNRKMEPKTILSTTGRLRSTESIRKAKEIFESMATTTKKHRDDVRIHNKLNRSPHDHEHPHEDHEHSPTPREPSPSHAKPFERQKTPTHKVDHDTNKFGIVLKKTDSESQRRKFTSIEIENILTTHEIEEIYDIDILEFLGGGKPTVITRTFTHPITQEDLDTIWDEQTLKLLLERSTDYEERRIIRGRLRDVMAEKEDLTKATEESSGRVEGESLLLPLLQGLLDAPDNEQTADSGTESGEDLRNGLLVEVQNVLAKASRVSSSVGERLQTGLSHPSSNERRSSGHERFSKKRRQNRHTVGVSSEELENARKLIEEMGLCTNKTSEDKHKSQEHITIPSVIKNVVAKPYQSPGSTSQSASCTSSAVNTPTEVTGVLQFSNPLASIRPKDLKLEQNKPKPFNQLVSSNFFPEIEKKTLHNAHESDEDFVKPVDNASTLLQSNPIYKPTNFPELDEQKINNRFNNKKLKLKRANTIDIPKPANTYESEDDYDSDTSLVDRQSTRRNNYLALRGPIRVGRNATTGNNVPIFEPKTESDRKFMAFINKHNENSDKSSLWAHQGQELNNRGNNWNNRFGNIRTAFEKAAVSNSTTPTPTMNSARNFWKRAENASSYCEQNNVPKGKLLQRRSEYISKDKEEMAHKMPWSVNENEVVTGSLKVETKGLDVNKNYKFVPQPLPVNKFSHAPTSAFAAIPKKYPDVISTKLNPPGNVLKSDYQNDSEANAPLFLYSPKPLTSTNTSPSSTPWASEISSVQKLASTNSIPESTALDKVTAPYINKSVENANTVRKLSDQFNNKTPKQPDTYLTTTTVRTNYTVPKYPVGDYTQCQPPSYDHYKTSKTHTPTYQTQSSIQSQPPSPQAPTQYYQKHHYQDVPKEQPTYKTISAPKESRLSDEYISQSYLKIKPPSKPESDLSSSDSSPTPQYNRQVSQESVKEYEAAVTKVMKGPVSQQAVTVQQNSPRGRDQHDMEVALNLKNAFAKVCRKITRTETFDRFGSFNKINRRLLICKEKPKALRKFPKRLIQTLCKFHIPVTIQSTLSKSPTQQQTVKKSDLWNQLMYDQQQVSQKPAPISSPNSKSVLRSKSSHSLAKRTVEAYFSGSISPQSLNKTPSDDSLDRSDKVEVKVSKSSINRKKTSEKISANKQTIGVSRSQTLPNIACPDMLDESKVEESFEDLFRSNA
ncbi:hypothetical protein FQR65_LT18943 [Abscondita terminalis]|nr:hypothetical protein FQR65_LT18943 [Abscondita terminalis]